MGAEEPEQQEVVYITNLEDGLRKVGTALYDEKDPNEKKPAAGNKPIEVPSLNNPNYMFLIFMGNLIVMSSTLKIFRRETARKNSKEYDYANMDLEKEGKQADLQELNIT